MKRVQQCVHKSSQMLLAYKQQKLHVILKYTKKPFYCCTAWKGLRCLSSYSQCPTGNRSFLSPTQKFRPTAMLKLSQYEF